MTPLRTQIAAARRVPTTDSDRVTTAKRQARNQGYACQEYARADGSTDLILTKKAGR